MDQSNAAAGLHATALALAATGKPVFPVKIDKRPLTRHGHLDATTDPERIRGWCNRWPTANIAMRTGAPSGLVVLDVDGQEGADSLHELEAQHGLLPTTTSVVTPRGGAHHYFRWPGGAVKSTAGAIGPGLDVRGDGGFVLVPPSRTNAGGYEWDATVPAAEMPAWLVELTRERDEPGGATPPDVWTAMLEDGIGDGSRNVDLARLTGYLLCHYVAVDVTAGLVHLVNEHRCKPPKPPGEVDQIIDSISRAELRRRESRS